MQKVLVISESGITESAAKVLEEIASHFPKLIAIVGKDCRVLEDLCDEYCERSKAGLDVCTSSHPDESVAEVREFVELFAEEDLGRDYQTVKL